MPKQKPRQRNDGLRKLCGCPRKRWSECRHSWYFNFKWKNQHYRFSLDKELRRRIDSKTEAEKEAERLRTAIRDGLFRAELPARDTLTIAQLFDTFTKRYLQTARAATIRNTRYQINAITRTVLQHPNGTARPFGEWLVADVTTDTIEQYREVRLPAGLAGTNRDLPLLRAMFNWAIRMGYLDRTPFKHGSEPVVKMTRGEAPRSRRLES